MRILLKGTWRCFPACSYKLSIGVGESWCRRQSIYLASDSLSVVLTRPESRGDRGAGPRPPGASLPYAAPSCRGAAAAAEVQSSHASQPSSERMEKWARGRCGEIGGIEECLSCDSSTLGLPVFISAQSGRPHVSQKSRAEPRLYPFLLR